MGLFGSKKEEELRGEIQRLVDENHDLVWDKLELERKIRELDAEPEPKKEPEPEQRQPDLLKLPKRTQPLYLWKKFFLRAHDRAFICGIPESGKSHFLKRMLYGAGYNIAIFDVENEFGKLRLPIATGDSYIKLWESGHKKMRIVPPKMSRGNLIEYYDEVADYFFDAGNVMFITDECHTVCSKSKIPDALTNMITRGRKRHICVINVTQRPQKVHNDIITLSNHQFAFLITHENDISAVGKGIPMLKFIMPRLEMWQMIHYCAVPKRAKQYEIYDKDLVEIARGEILNPKL